MGPLLRLRMRLLLSGDGVINIQRLAGTAMQTVMVDYDDEDNDVDDVDDIDDGAG